MNTELLRMSFEELLNEFEYSIIMETQHKKNYSARYKAKEIREALLLRAAEHLMY